MKPSTRNKILGTVHAVKGKLKQKAGQLAEDLSLEAEGATENITGRIQKKIGEAEALVEKP